MRVKRIEFRLDELEEKTLKLVAHKYGLSLGNYIRRKLFHENEDLMELEQRFISPNTDKHRLLSTSLTYKALYLIKIMLETLGSTTIEINLLEQQALEYARKQREQYGYKILAADLATEDYQQTQQTQQMQQMQQTNAIEDKEAKIKEKENKKEKGLS